MSGVNESSSGVSINGMVSMKAFVVLVLSPDLS